MPTPRCCTPPNCCPPLPTPSPPTHRAVAPTPLLPPPPPLGYNRSLKTHIFILILSLSFLKIFVIFRALSALGVKKPPLGSYKRLLNNFLGCWNGFNFLTSRVLAFFRKKRAIWHFFLTFIFHRSGLFRRRGQKSSLRFNNILLKRFDLP